MLTVPAVPSKVERRTWTLTALYIYGSCISETSIVRLCLIHEGLLLYMAEQA